MRSAIEISSSSRRHGMNDTHPIAPANAVTEESPDSFAPHIPRVFDWALRLTHHRQDALDVVQDVFLKWQRQCAIAVPDSPAAWLRRVTTNRALELGRRRSGESMAALKRAQCADLRLASGSGPERTVERSFLREDLLGAMALLSESQREVLMAKLLDEQTFAKIAEDMRIAVSTAKTHYLRAIRAMRDALAPRWEDET